MAAEASPSDHCAMSAATRLRFERRGTLLCLAVIALALAACFVALWPAPWSKLLADRIVELKDPILDFVLALGGLLGLSWGRGHMDRRIEGG